MNTAPTTELRSSNRSSPDGDWAGTGASLLILARVNEMTGEKDSSATGVTKAGLLKCKRRNQMTPFANRRAWRVDRQVHLNPLGRVAAVVEIHPAFGAKDRYAVDSADRSLAVKHVYAGRVYKGKGSIVFLHCVLNSKYLHHIWTNVKAVSCNNTYAGVEWRS